MYSYSHKSLICLLNRVANLEIKFCLLNCMNPEFKLIHLCLKAEAKSALDKLIIYGSVKLQECPLLVHNFFIIVNIKPGLHYLDGSRKIK